MLQIADRLPAVRPGTGAGFDGRTPATNPGLGCVVALLAMLVAHDAAAQTIVGADLIEPTDRYAHGAMGPDVADHGALSLMLADGGVRIIRLPAARVFEDNEARLADVTGDGALEVVVVESDQRLGARLSVYGADGLIAASPFIGQRHRWMAVAGIGDLDGDGRVEIAAVDRPHLRRTLVIWRQEGGTLTPVAELPGVTNHRFGAPLILGGLRECGSGSEIVLARGDWSGLLAVRFNGLSLDARVIPGPADAAGFAGAMGCDG
jgi:hypothetical protein